MPRGMSLADWKRVGLLDREWSLYHRLGSKIRRLCVVLTGTEDNAAIESDLQTQADGQYQLSFIRALPGAPWEQTLAELPARVLAQIGGGSGARTVVKTEQLTSGPVAVEIRDALRRAGHEAALVTRGGYLWSRFSALEFGPDSPQARSAADSERVLCRNADIVVGTTEDMIGDLSWRYRVDLARTAVIPNFVIPPETLKTSAERVPGLIVTAGALVSRKRIGILIEALCRLDDDLRSRVVLEVIGDGPQEAALRDLAAKSNAPVQFKPPLPHARLLERLGQCFVYAQASELEGHPKAVIDAMAAGAVAVVADSPGLGSLIRTGSTGVLIPSADPADFANAFTGLLADTDWCDLLGGNAARHAAMHFGIDTVLPLELDAYKRAFEYAAKRAAAA